MYSSFDEAMAILQNPQGIPCVALILAIVGIMVGRILALSIHIIFAFASFFIVCAFMATFFNHGNDQLNINGISFSPLIVLALQILLPTLLAFLGMIYAKNMAPNRKIECLLLLFISFLGGIVTLASTNWMMFFVGLQCLSLPLFGLLALDYQSTTAISASIRYLMLSSVSLACMLFGIALLYAQTGTLNFMSQALPLSILPNSSLGITLLGLSLIFAGLSFKLSLAPFHFWAPVVYESSAYFVVGYFLIVAKAVLIFFLLQNNWLIFAVKSTLIVNILLCLACISMVVGCGLMMIEKKIMRFLAYASIGHLGFLIAPLLANSQLGITAIVIDFFAFAVAIVLIFAALKDIKAKHHYLTVHDLKGLIKNNYARTIILIVALASMAGIPLTAGFIAKYSIFMSAAQAEQWILLFVMVFSSAMMLVSIFKIIFSLLNPSDSSEPQAALSFNSGLLALGALAILAFGIFPNPWLEWVNQQVIQQLKNPPIEISQK